jgi:hypothetical protein
MSRLLLLAIFAMFAFLSLYKIARVCLKPFKLRFWHISPKTLEALNKRHFLWAFGPMISLSACAPIKVYTRPTPLFAFKVSEPLIQARQENEQDQALAKLESHSYFQGSRNIYRYTDDFEELAVTAGYSDALIRVTKYRSGLDPRINLVITTSRTAPDLTDYDGWRTRAFRQYEAFGRARTGNLPARLLAALPRPRAADVSGSSARAPGGRSDGC